MAFISSDKGRILVKVEDLEDYGQDAVDAALGSTEEDLVYQAIRARNIISPQRTEIASPRVKGGIASSRKATQPNECDINAEVVVTGLGPNSDFPEWHPFFVAANMQATVDPGNSILYTPSLYPDKSLTIYEFKDNLEDPKSRLQKTTGARGTFALNFSLDEEAYFTWEGTGLYSHPGKAQQYYDTNRSLAVKEDGTTPFTSHDQFVTILDAEEGHEYQIFIDGFEFSHTALLADDEGDIATALAGLINSSTDVDVDATATGPEIQLEATDVGDRFYAKLHPREDGMSIFSRERWSRDEDVIQASQMSVTCSGLSWEVSGIQMSQNMSPESVRTITGPSGTERVLNTKALDANTMFTIELLDGNEDVYNQVMDAWEDDGFLTLNVLAENAGTEMEIIVHRLQIANPEMSEQGGFVGWTINAVASGQWDEVGGGSDFTVELRRK